MKIHEYQAKEIISRYGIPVPKGIVASTVDEAIKAAQELPGKISVVKAQIHAGGRGKGGGVKVCFSPKEVQENAAAILGMQLVTHQTGPEGQTVKTLLVEEGLGIKKELYFSMLVDRSSKRIVLLASTEGGMNIEEVAETTPEKIFKEEVNPALGLCLFQAQRLAFKLELHKISPKLIRKATSFFMSLYQVFVDQDASLLEINPMLITDQDDLLALDCKMDFDDNALFRNPDITLLRDQNEEDPTEIEADSHGLNFIKLDGTIGCMVNGAGLAMGTMDIIKHYKGSPANFLDVGGTATSDRVEAAFRLISSDPNVSCILVNIFGGIVRCDVIARGIVTAFKTIKLQIPVVVRLRGSNATEALKIIKESDFSDQLIMIENLSLAAQKSVELSK